MHCFEICGVSGEPKTELKTARADAGTGGGGAQSDRTAFG
jgi:hypothetical protein